MAKYEVLDTVIVAGSRSHTHSSAIQYLVAGVEALGGMPKLPPYFEALQLQRSRSILLPYYLAT